MNRLVNKSYEAIRQEAKDYAKTHNLKLTLSQTKVANFYGFKNFSILRKYFDNIIGLDNIYAGSKTHLGLMLIEQLNLPGNEVLFIGDTLHDAEVAKAMGVDCVLISNGHQVKETLMVNYNLVFEDLKILKDYLKL